MRRALVTGCNGQDGSYLAEILLREGYQVDGLVRPSGDDRLWRLRNVIDHPQFALKYGDILDTRLAEDVGSAGYDIVYHLAAMPFVGQSFQAPTLAISTNATASVALMDALYRRGRTTKFYFAATSEMFAGMTAPFVGDEGAALDARSPYGAAKICAYLVGRTYRERGLFVVNGIGYNHESVRRGTNYVTRKVGLGVRRFAQTGVPVRLGNIDSQRDWHHAADTMQAAFLATHHHTPDDYVLASGVTHSVKEMAQMVCEKFNVAYDEAIEVNASERRPWDVEYLCGDASKACKVLGWEPKYSWNALVDDVCRPEGDV